MFDFRALLEILDFWGVPNNSRLLECSLQCQIYGIFLKILDLQGTDLTMLDLHSESAARPLMICNALITRP